MLTLFKNICTCIVYTAALFVAGFVLIILLYGPLSYLEHHHYNWWEIASFYVIEFGTVWGIGNTVIDYFFNKKYGKK